LASRFWAAFAAIVTFTHRPDLPALWQIVTLAGFAEVVVPAVVVVEVPPFGGFPFASA
jgi:hypothetical protein